MKTLTKLLISVVILIIFTVVISGYILNEINIMIANGFLPEKFNFLGFLMDALNGNYENMMMSIGM